MSEEQRQSLWDISFWESSGLNLIDPKPYKPRWRGGHWKNWIWKSSGLGEIGVDAFDEILLQDASLEDGAQYSISNSSYCDDISWLIGDLFSLESNEPSEDHVELLDAGLAKVDADYNFVPFTKFFDFPLDI